MTERDKQLLIDQMRATDQTIKDYAAALGGDEEATARLAEDYGVPVDEYDVNDAIGEWPLEVVDERGRDFAVVLTIGGPHIEITASGGSNPTLEGYWGADRWSMGSADHLTTILDYFIDRD
ncbi:hypothetical protein [Mycobacteroides immunogenum]|jgi:hypothetical protein|uniref:hypothetical protein n=1 Tax=Mycobacteroides immunogenum TaxID=83262 RepID=UPI0006BA492A|nr:hypothetical protein [Mycobacteroides immunogenum]